MRQTTLFDDCPLADLWERTEPDPESRLRQRWTADGVLEARQTEIIDQITAAEAPGAWAGPFQIPTQPRMTPGSLVRAQAAAAVACREAKTREENQGHCLKCDKIMATSAMFCSKKCRSTWIAQRDRDCTRLAKTTLVVSDVSEISLF